MNDDSDAKMSEEEIWVALNEDIPHQELRAYLPYGRDWKGASPVLPKDINVFFSNGLPKITLFIEADMACDCYLLAFDFRLSTEPSYELTNPRQQRWNCSVALRLWVLPVRRCDGRMFERNEAKHVYGIECRISDASPGHFDGARQEAIGPYAVPPRLPFFIRRGETEYVAEYVSEYAERKKDPCYVCDYVAAKATAKAQAEALQIFSAHYQPLFPEATAQLLPLFRKPSKRKPKPTTHDSQPVARQQVSNLWSKYETETRAYFGRPTYKDFWGNGDWQSLLQKAGIQSFEHLKKIIHSLRMVEHRNRKMREKQRRPANSHEKCV